MSQLKWFLLLIALLVAALPAPAAAPGRPNILLAISDDQSWPHTSANGSRMVHTPAFDQLAGMGVRFSNCIAGSPGCSPSRAVLLTGLNHWQIEQAGTHASSFPTDYVTYPDLLERAGYFVGYTRKGWGPGNFTISGRERNPAGPAFNRRKLIPPYRGLNKEDYAGNFADFLAARPEGRPFCFWYGASEPHRGYEKGSGLKAGKKLADAEVPPFLPDTPEVRSDLLDYALEIEWFDQHLGRMLEMLEAAGELENTLIIVTADNGMPFPRAKANVYEYGIHMPLVMAWPHHVPGGRVVEDVVGFVDITATILEAAGVAHPARDSRLAPVGRSLMKLLGSGRQGLVEEDRRMVFSGRERHSSSRPGNLGYPARALRTSRFLYIRNFAPERWPAGDPRQFDELGNLGPMHGAYRDIDGSPTRSFLVAHHADAVFGKFLHLAVDPRTREELFDIRKDPACLDDLAAKAPFATELERLREAMDRYLTETGDPRMGPNPDIWETYPRYSRIRSFPPSPPAEPMNPTEGP